MVDENVVHAEVIRLRGEVSELNGNLNAVSSAVGNLQKEFSEMRSVIVGGLDMSRPSLIDVVKSHEEWIRKRNSSDNQKIEAVESEKVWIRRLILGLFITNIFGVASILVGVFYSQVVKAIGG